MAMAAQGMPSPGLVLATLAGGAMAAGGANAVNCYLERDTDKLMGRTQRRPLPRGRVDPEKALAFGILLAGGGFIVLQSLVNLLAAGLAAGAGLFYVPVYTLLLKRTTSQNIVIGGAAGAMPPVVGWAAVTGSLDMPAFILFAIVLTWTPPHFWALALNYGSDYKRAGIPMLPVAHGVEETARHIFLYSLLMVAVTTLLFSVEAAGYVYLATALLLGGIFIWLAFELWQRPRPTSAMALFRYSVLYLALLFAAMVVDEAVRL
jgi:protoheme IX farnesyltransferase